MGDRRKERTHQARDGPCGWLIGLTSWRMSPRFLPAADGGTGFRRLIPAVQDVAGGASVAREESDMPPRTGRFCALRFLIENRIKPRSDRLSAADLNRRGGTTWRDLITSGSFSVSYFDGNFILRKD